MKKLLLFLVLLSTSYLVLSTASHAQSPSLSPTESIRDSVKKQVAEELSQIKLAVAKKGFVGTISAKSDGTITITNFKNESRTATLTADAAIKLTGNKDGTPSDLKVDDFVIAMGDVDSSNKMTVKRLLVIATPQVDSRRTLFGTVTKISASQLIVEVTDKKTFTVKLQSATKYTGKTKVTDIKVNSKIVVVGTSTTETALTARVIHLFAQ